MQPLFGGRFVFRYRPQGGCPRHLIDIDKTAPQRYVYRRGATTLSRNPVRHCKAGRNKKKQPLFSDCFVTPERLELSTQ